MKKLPESGNMFTATEHYRKKSNLPVKLTSAFLVFILCLFQANAQQHQVDEDHPPANHFFHM